MSVRCDWPPPTVEQFLSDGGEDKVGGELFWASPSYACACRRGALQRLRDHPTALPRMESLSAWVK
jgi:hypothetical protein